MDSKSNLNINPITKLSSFIAEYPDQSLHEHFNLLQQSFPTHRAVRGDGNCFYRCFAFLYLAISPCNNYHAVFPTTTWSYKKQHSQIQSDRQFQSKLQEVWNQYIKGLEGLKNREEKQQKLQNFFNKIRIFDELMIGYFRSINYQQMKKNKNKLLPFVQGDSDFQKQLQRISKFGSQSQGIEIHNLASVMKVHITIFCVDHNGFQPISYMQHLGDKGLKDFYLFFRPGHYDIVYPYQTIEHNQSTRFINTTRFQSKYGQLKFTFKPQKQNSIRAQKPNLVKSQKSNLTKLQKYSSTKIEKQSIINEHQLKKNKSQNNKLYIRQNSTGSSSNSGKYDLINKPSDKQQKNEKNKHQLAKKVVQLCKKGQKLQTLQVNDQHSTQRLFIEIMVLFLILGSARYVYLSIF